MLYSFQFRQIWKSLLATADLRTKKISYVVKNFNLIITHLWLIKKFPLISPIFYFFSRFLLCRQVNFGKITE